MPSFRSKRGRRGRRVSYPILSRVKHTWEPPGGWKWEAPGATLVETPKDEYGVPRYVWLLGANQPPYYYLTQDRQIYGGRPSSGADYHHIVWSSKEKAIEEGIRANKYGFDAVVNEGPVPDPYDKRFKAVWKAKGHKDVEEREAIRTQRWVRKYSNIFAQKYHLNPEDLHLEIVDDMAQMHFEEDLSTEAKVSKFVEEKAKGMREVLDEEGD